MSVEHPDTTPGRKRRWPNALILCGTLAAGMALGAAGLAGAANFGGHMGWRQHGPRLERIQNFVRMALDSVAATSDQQAKVHDVVAAAFTDLTPKPEDQAALRKQAVDLLRAPTVDKAALEKLRADFVARQDEKSKRFLSAVEQVADLLTPTQRAQLADEAEMWTMRSPWMRKYGGGRKWGRDDRKQGPPSDAPDSDTP